VFLLLPEIIRGLGTYVLCGSYQLVLGFGCFLVHAGREQGSMERISGFQHQLSHLPF
jgi:hypothetical protein